MTVEKQNIEFEEQQEAPVQQFSLRSLIDGNVLNQRVVRKQLPFLLLLMLISLLMIANRNHAEKLVIQTNELQSEVKELRSKSISTSSELMMISRQTIVEQMVKERGLNLEENKEPLKKLILKKEN